MKKIILVYPKTGADRRNILTKPPLSILSLVPWLIENEYDVLIIDQRVDDNWKEKISKALSESPVICAGVSVMTGPQIEYGLAVSNLIKRQSPDVPVVWGGAHPSCLPEQTLKHPSVDIVVDGEGEATFLDLVQAIDHKRDLSTVSGIYFKRQNEIIQTGQRPLLDIDTIPEIPYDLIDLTPYFNLFIEGQKSLMIIPDRGCPHRCTFCYVPIFYNRRVRISSPAKVYQKIVDISKYKPEIIDIGSENFFADKHRVSDLCDLLIESKLNIKFKAQCRIDYIDRWDKEFLLKMKQAGFYVLQLGAESGSDRILELIQKGITTEQIIRVNQKLAEVEIAPYYSFFIGSPQETYEDIIATIKLVLYLLKTNPLAKATNLQLFKPIPGTPMFEEAVNLGFKVPESLEGWIDFLNIDYPWRSEREMNLYHTLDIVSYFFKENAVGDAFNSRIIRLGARIYSALVRYRCIHEFWWAFPEVKILKFIQDRYLND